MEPRFSARTGRDVASPPLPSLRLGSFHLSGCAQEKSCLLRQPLPCSEGLEALRGGIQRGRAFVLPSDDIEGWILAVRTGWHNFRTGSKLDLELGTQVLLGATPLVGVHPVLNDDAQLVPPGGAKRKRPDMPVVRKQDKANRTSVVDDFIAEGPAGRSKCLNDLMRDMYASSSRAPRDSQLNTWTAFHHLWFGEESQPWPLDEDKLVRVSSLFKAAGYKSYKNYLSRAKEHHVMLGHPWTDRLDILARKCSRSVLRGLAGASRSEAFDLAKVVGALEESDGPFHNEGPVHVQSLIVCATMFMLREVEASALDVADLTLSANVVSLNISLSPKLTGEPKGA